MFATFTRMKEWFFGVPSRKPFVTVTRPKGLAKLGSGCTLNPSAVTMEG